MNRPNMDTTAPGREGHRGPGRRKSGATKVSSIDRRVSVCLLSLIVLCEAASCAGTPRQELETPPSGGTITVNGLRFAVAIGVAFGVAMGTFRIVTGTPLHWYIIVGYVVVIIQTAVAPRAIIPLAYDSGGVTTSTVTVPLVAALGLGLAETIPGRSPLLDGFGLIAFASLFPMISVMAYAQISEWRSRRARLSADELPSPRED